MELFCYRSDYPVSSVWLLGIKKRPDEIPVTDDPVNHGFVYRGERVL